MKKEKKREYQLENVTVAPYGYTYLVGLPLFLIVFLAYGQFGLRYFGFLGLITVFVVTLGIIYYVLRKRSQTLMVGIDSQYFYIDNKKYRKEDIKGFYSYDYINSKKSVISVQVRFHSGKKIEIIDTEFRDEYNEVKSALLKDFLKTVLLEFDFRNSGKSKIRALQNLGAYWYSNN